MSILEKEVWVGLNPQAINHFSNLGYDIPKHKDKNGIIRVKRGTKLLAKIEDILDNTKVTKVCDFCGSRIKTSFAKILEGRDKWFDGKDRCKKCSDKIKLTLVQNARLDSNCVAKTHPEFSKLFWEKDDTYKFTCQSNKKTDFKCPDCGIKIKNKRIQDVYKYGLPCPHCSDGYSYPEKFMFNLLSQVGIKFDTQKSFKWGNGRRYDFYIPSLNCIIETHGVQHYEGNGFKAYDINARNVKEEQLNDLLKRKLALENGITKQKYIIIDSRRSTLNFMKESILKNEELNKLIDTYYIDFTTCHEFASKNIIKIVSDLFYEGYSNVNIAEKLMINRHTVGRYLKKAEDAGWIKYNPSASKFHSVVQLDINGDYISEYINMIEASRKTGCNYSSIGNVCAGRHKTAGGFRWMYKHEYEKNKSYLKFVPLKNTKTVVQLDNNGNFIKEWDSIKAASSVLGVNNSSIVSTCKGKNKSAGGFKWMYIEEYNKSN